MISVLIKGEDAFWLNGMKYVLSDALGYQGLQNVCFLPDYSTDSIQKADLIIIRLQPGESISCIYELRHRRQGVIIGVVDSLDSKRVQRPTCFQDMVFITMNSSVEWTKLFIQDIWEKYNLNAWHHEENVCFHCPRKALSFQQARIMTLFYAGRTMPEIAGKLSINIKTVFSQKYLVMRRFNLRSDYELHKFLSTQLVKTISPPSFILGNVVRN
ncbi:LuxR C-terminal-related transcriptional regulator [Enterobacter sp. CC120223-11]|uniref:helix-turn-helix transcriptional regulator n=1 Tax=Enterobacter sp. CC120223-11 TaxID=1378073 RepID=UPI001596CB29|nr:LuxR C-terminal-related transcriptional regulator [Enterobacter sp. CC120223-11]